MAPTKKTSAKAAKKEVEKVLTNAAGEGFMRAASREMTKQTTHVPMRSKGGRVKPKDTKGSKRGEVVSEKRLMRQQTPVLNSRLADYFRQLENPWKYQGVRCPVNYNPVPSFMVTTAHTTYTANVLVGVNFQRQITLFPGHAPPSDTDAMDGASYHCFAYQIGANTYSIGPVNTTGPLTGAIGFISPDITVGVDVMNSSVGGYVPLTADVTLPYVATAAQGGHTRWKLVSMGIKVINQTAIGSRGGQVIHVQPSSNIIPTGGIMVDFASQPTFRITQEANEGTLTLTWIPRADDLAYWHTENSASGFNPWNAGINVWIQNPTGVAQTYNYEIVCNWELSGHSLAAVSSPTVHQPADKNVLEPALSVMNFTKSTASGALAIATTVAQHAAPFIPAVASALNSPMGKAIGSLFGV